MRFQIRKEEVTTFRITEAMKLGKYNFLKRSPRQLDFMLVLNKLHTVKVQTLAC